MKTIVLLFLVLLVSCSKTDSQQRFNILNPITKKTAWQKLSGLPPFNPQMHSDGCSGGMSAMYARMTFLHKNNNRKLRWHECCVIHDEAYYYGGNKQEKKQADKALSQCVTAVIGHKFLGKAMQLAVKVGGSPHLPTPYRWGYGEDFREE